MFHVVQKVQKWPNNKKKLVFYKSMEYETKF